MIHLLHVGPLSPHVHSVRRLFDRYGPQDLMQEHVLPGESPSRSPDLILLHHAQNLVGELERYPHIPTVARLWNLRWVNQKGAKDIHAALARCAMVLGFPHTPSMTEGWNYRNLFPLVDADTFTPGEREDREGFFACRLIRGDCINVYWGAEVERALGAVPYAIAMGGASSQEMARNFRAAQVVIGCGIDPYIANSTVEAVLCGAIPVLSDTVPHREHFTEGEQVVGARLCTQDPESIREACVQVAELWADPAAWEAEVARNREHFAEWTAQAQGRQLVADVLACAGVTV